MNKKGLSDVVTTVLIILLAVAAVSAIWIAIKPIIEKSGRAIPVQEICLKNTIDIKTCQRFDESEQTGYNVAYIRSKGDEKVTLKNIRVSLTKDSNLLNQNKSDVPSIGQIDSIKVLTSQTFKKAIITAEYSTQDGTISTSCQTKTISCSADSLSFFPEEEFICNNNGIVDEGEECDGYESIVHKWCTGYKASDSSWNGLNEDGSLYNWESQGLREGNYVAGSVSCNDDCREVFSECLKPNICGNNLRESDEICDGGEWLNGAFCYNYNKDTHEFTDGFQEGNYESGYLSCSNQCTADFGDCSDDPSGSGGH